MKVLKQIYRFLQGSNYRLCSGFMIGFRSDKYYDYNIKNNIS